jgi:alpha-L-rhamnosidase
VPGITWARASHASPRGRLLVGWRQERGIFSLELELPPNTSAEVSMPAVDVATVREGDRPVGQAAGVRFVRQEPGRVLLAVESGVYAFTAPAR